VGVAVVNNLVPAIACLRQIYSLKVSCVFTPRYLQSQGAPDDLKFSDLERSDALFDSFILKWVSFSGFILKENALTV